MGRPKGPIISPVPPHRRRKPVVVLLPAEEFDVLEKMAAEHDRDPYQQARFLLRHGLGLIEPQKDRETTDVA